MRGPAGLTCVEAVAAGVADQRGDPDGETGGGQAEAGETLLGEVELGVGLCGVGEGGAEGELGLGVERLDLYPRNS
ncbi:hypothetical protein ACWCXH_33980 [Kitasatospora sp. NPDC001660]